MEYSQPTAHPSNHLKKWTPEERDKIIEEIRLGKSHAEIGQQLRRSERSIFCQAREMAHKEYKEGKITLDKIPKKYLLSIDYFKKTIAIKEANNIIKEARKKEREAKKKERDKEKKKETAPPKQTKKTWKDIYPIVMETHAMIKEIRDLFQKFVKDYEIED